MTNYLYCNNKLVISLTRYNEILTRYMYNDFFHFSTWTFSAFVNYKYI